MDPKMEGMTRPKLPKNLSKKDFKKLVSDPALHSWEAKGESLKDVETLLEGRKTKIAILISYCGKDYYGLQHNPGDDKLETVEKKLFEGLVAAKVCYSNVLLDRKRMAWQSCSRTDKGVSAIGNVASLKMIDCENVLELINQKLPDDIRILGMQRVTKGFCAKNRCTHRTYSYYCPTYCFGTTEDWKTPEKFRISKDKINLINELLARYVGTKSYHNFTSGKRQGDMSAMRHILNFECFGEPFICSNVEYIELRVKGQSFMIHQIRKMVGLVIARTGNHCKDDHFERAFDAAFEDVPKAPGNGLVLRQVHFDTYNRDYGKVHGAVDWKDSQDIMDKFAKEKIMPVIFDMDIAENNMIDWLKNLELHDFTGVRAAAQWASQEMSRESVKRKAEDAIEESDSKVEKKEEAIL